MLIQCKFICFTVLIALLMPLLLLVPSCKCLPQSSLMTGSVCQEADYITSFRVRAYTVECVAVVGLAAVLY